MSDPSAPPAMTRARRMEDCLRDALHPATLHVIDESARHAGHSGARREGETHYAITIVSEQFSGLNRIARSRMVNDLLAKEFASGLHALSLVLRSPGEHSS